MCLQMVFSSPPSSMFGALSGLLAGIFYRAEALPLRNAELPFLASVCAYFFGSRPSTRTHLQVAPSRQRLNNGEVDTLLPQRDGFGFAAAPPRAPPRASGARGDATSTTTAAGGGGGGGGGGGRGGAAAAAPRPARPRDEDVQALVDMGFGREVSIQALQSSNGSLAIATNILLGD
eukprot:gnl/Spiro4/18888_TR10094_c0_g1_i1.p2 gnl/Spiro4/18888_TR10094_c0_g1~~gnl/Spiro4/18888_TR10094_c0_g1_i1.p2  ORF type:complete len:176 (+),score=47.11 gnl/Spiro4/18888_TR10094_c0_g1_i1:687-1214(+)